MFLDHLAIAGETLEAAVGHVEEALGVALLPGGKHAYFGTHNRLLGLADGLYLEAIATDPEADQPEVARWFDLDRFQGPPRLSNWICRCDDLDKTLAALFVDLGQPVALRRGDLAWRMAVPEDGILPFEGCFPALMQWDVKSPPGDILAGSGCRLLRLEIAHPEAVLLRDLLPLQDARIAIVSGDAALRATFETPHGVRILQ